MLMLRGSWSVRKWDGRLAPAHQIGMTVSEVTAKYKAPAANWR